MKLQGDCKGNASFSSPIDLKHLRGNIGYNVGYGKIRLEGLAISLKRVQH